MNYILFIGQEGNFQSRSILIPEKEFIEYNNDTYTLLKSKSIKNHVFSIDDDDYMIDNLLIQDYKIEGSMGKPVMTKYSEICWKLANYADGMEEDHYFDIKDKHWYDKSITNICGGFNHIKNYKKCRMMTTVKGKEINIVDGFLFLEATNGKLKLPSCDTVKEMYLKYFGMYVDDNMKQYD